MIAQTFPEVFSPQWIETHLSNSTHDLIILHHIIPWQPIIDDLVSFYNLNKGRTGCALRTLSAVSILSRLRQLSDRKVIEEIKENRYMQYFCNVPDPGLMTFMHPSTLCCFRKRVGKEGIGLIEDEVFSSLKRAGVINADMMLMDSTVLDSPIMYPTDVRLLYKAFDKMAILATKGRIEPWWNLDLIKKRWRAYNLDRNNRATYLSEFYPLFQPAFEGLKARLEPLEESPHDIAVSDALNQVRIHRSWLRAVCEQQDFLPGRLNHPVLVPASGRKKNDDNSSDQSRDGDKGSISWKFAGNRGHVSKC